MIRFRVPAGGWAAGGTPRHFRYTAAVKLAGGAIRAAAPANKFASATIERIAPRGVFWLAFSRTSTQLNKR